MSLVATNLCFSYRPGAPVLREVSLEVCAGRIVVLLGPNGSGKSTFLRVMLGQLTADRGEVLLEGRALRELSRRDVARQIAYLPQSPAHEPGQRVVDVIRAGRMPYLGAFGVESDRDIQVVKDTAGLLHLTELLDQPVDELSGGQRQRVFLARALAQEPRIFLLDEPNTFLDLRHQAEIWQLLRRVAREKKIAILAASHDLNLSAAFADELFLLKGGQVVGRGTANEVLDAGVLSDVYGIAMERIDRAGRAPVVVPDVVG